MLRFKLPLPSAKSQSKWIIGLTVLVLISIGLGLLDVPGFRSPVQKIRYLVHLSQTFHNTLFEGIKLIPPNARTYYYQGRTRAEEISTLYTRAHLLNLQPAKCSDYHHYFDLVNRLDLKPHYAERGIAFSPGDPAFIFAFNVYEILWTQTKFPAARMIYHVQKGNAEAAIYELTAPKLSESRKPVLTLPLGKPPSP